MAQNLFSLEGRVALITGGNGGIGLGIGRGFRDAGASLALAGRNPDKNAAVADEFGADHGVYDLDVRDEAAVEATVAQVVERFGRLDILVNNAGQFIGGSVLDMKLDDWNAVIGTHLTGSMLCAKHAARAMVAAGRGGKIINIASMYSVYGAINGADYASAKTGILGLTRSHAAELGCENIQVNAILPGWILTDMTGELPDSKRGDNIVRKTPAGRWGESDDLAGTAVFLASAASDFVSGVAIPVDGGFSITERFYPDD